MPREELFTCGTWTVRAGREDDFVAAWTDLAEWTTENFEDAGWARLVQQRDEPRRFLSFGPWPSEELVAEWRGSDGFRQRVGHMQEMLESFEPGLFDARAQVGGGP